MLNVIWFLLLGCGVLYAALHGNLSEVTATFFSSGEQALQLGITLAAIMMLWNGILRIMEQSGLTALLAKVLRPLVRLLFPRFADNERVCAPIIMNMAANLLGLGNAATPFGLAAMQELQRVDGKGDLATDEMIVLLLLNTSAITLIPSTVIGLRSVAGSVAPEEIIILTILAGICGLLAGLLAHFLLSCKVKRR